MSGPELMQYRSLFHGLNDGRPVSRSQPDGVFAKACAGEGGATPHRVGTTRARCRQASLPRDEVDYIWLLSDLDMDGAGFPLLLAHCLRPLAYPPAGIPALP